MYDFKIKALLDGETVNLVFSQSRSDGNEGELSPEKIRKILLSIQVSILYDTKKDKKFALPSKISTDAKKIYKLMEVPLSAKPYILCSAPFLK